MALLEILKRELERLTGERDSVRRQAIELDNRIKKMERQVNRLQHFITECDGDDDLTTPERGLHARDRNTGPRTPAGTLEGLSDTTKAFYQILKQHPNGALISEILEDFSTYYSNNEGMTVKNPHAYLDSLARRGLVRNEKAFGRNIYFLLPETQLPLPKE